MKQETIAKRQKEIFNTALQIFSKKGFRGTTLDEIAVKMKISKPAIYLYFRNKESLFFSMIADKMTGLQDNVFEILKSSIPSIQKLKKIISFITNFYINNIDFFRILHETGYHFDEKNQSKMHKNFIKNYGEFIKELEKLIQQCITDGHLKNIDPLFLSLALTGIMNQTVFGSLIIGKPSFQKNLDSKIIELFLEGAGK